MDRPVAASTVCAGDISQSQPSYTSWMTRRDAIQGLAAVACVVAVVMVIVGAKGLLGGIEEPSPEVRRMLPVVAHYLEAAGGTRQWTGDGWTLFCGIRYLGNSAMADRFDIYVWEACSEYRRYKGSIAESTGWSVPAVISMVKTRAGYRPVAEHQPGDGNLYGPDIGRMFPWTAERAIAKIPVDGTSVKMFKALKERARRELPPR